MKQAPRKIHSLDYDGKGVCSISSTNNRQQLMHSVSIVVELAKEQQQQQHPLPVHKGNHPLRREEGDLMDSIEGGREQERESNVPVNNNDDLEQEDFLSSLSSSKNIEHDDDEQQQQQQQKSIVQLITSRKNCPNQEITEMSLDEADEEEEEEEDDDDGGCLSSDLARKVVIVDEADKILRNRAQSAEPRLGSITPTTTSTTTSDETGNTTLTDLNNNNNNNSISKVPPPIPARTTLPFATESQHQQACGLSSFETNLTSNRNGQSAATCSPTTDLTTAAPADDDVSSSTAAATKKKVWTSNSELAEHGALSKLSMRRNTHHYVATASNTTKIVSGSCINATPAALMRPPAAISPITNVQQQQQQPAAASRWIQKHARSGSAQLERAYDPMLLVGPQFGVAATTKPPLVQRGMSIKPAIAYSQQQQQQQRGSTTTQASGSSNSNSNSSSNSNSNSIGQWYQRRQSLQINLLASGANSFSSSQSRLLTEEELRGEREFNEQVRSAKSPELFATGCGTGSGSLSGGLRQQQQQAGVLSGSSSSAASAAAAAVGRRCQSIAGGSSSSSSSLITRGALDLSLSSPSTSPFSGSGSGSSNLGADSGSCSVVGGKEEGISKLVSTASSSSSFRGVHLSSSHQITPHSIVKTNHHLPINSKQAKQHSQRRVSFSSIDPILSKAPELNTVKHSRASFAFQPTNYYSSNISYNNNPKQQSSDNKPINVHENNSDNNSKKLLSRGSIDAANSAGGFSFVANKLETTSKPIDKYKRHSIATNTANFNNKQNFQKLDQHQHQQQQQTSILSSVSHLKDSLSSSFRVDKSSKIAPFSSTSNSPVDDHQANDETNDENPSDQLRNSAASNVSKLIVSQEKQTTTNRNMNDNLAAEPHQQVDNNRRMQESSEVVEQQMESFKPKLEDEETESNGNNWTITSSTATNITTTTPTNAAKQQQAESNNNNTNTNKPLKDGSRVQTIMANAKLRQEEFARLLEEHEQIVNEINRVETKMSNSSSNSSSSSSQLNSQQRGLNTMPAEQEDK